MDHSKSLLATVLFSSLLIFTVQAQEAPSPAPSPIVDEEIVEAIETRLALSSEVRSTAVRAASDDGVVTLSGRVDNLLASHSAVDIASSVRGVQSIDNQIVVATAKVSDEQIQSSIKEAAESAFGDAVRAIDVKSVNGEVTLRGKVPGLATKKYIATEAASVGGVRKIINDLSLAAVAGRSDGELEAEINGMLNSLAELDDRKISASVTNAKASISGTVATLAEKRTAVGLASLNGVAEVLADNLLIDWNLKDGMNREKRFAELSDEKIESAIRSAVSHHPLLVSTKDAIEIAANGGKVTLTGSVSRVSMKDAVERAARNTVGVQGVRNRIQIEWPENPPSDEEITQSALKALHRDAYLSHAEVIPRSRNAHAHLYGSVDTEFEKRRAGYIVGAQPGVVHVANYLTVLGTWDEKSDDQIQEDIERELAVMRSAPHVEVTVKVKGGVPVFSGHVATWYQWQGLLRIAEKAGGRKPHNNVTIHYKPTGRGPGLYVPR